MHPAAATPAVGTAPGATNRATPCAFNLISRSCFGTTHFCASCHDRPGEMQEMQRKGTLPACPAAPLGKPIKVEAAVIAAAVAAGLGPGSGAPTPGCPLQCVHPAPGEEFCLGCSICREAATF